MNPFNLGPFELVFVLVVLLLLFGAKRLPELGSGLGKGIREFKRSVNDIRSEVDSRDDDRRIQPPPARNANPIPPQSQAQAPSQTGSAPDTRATQATSPAEPAAQGPSGNDEPAPDAGRQNG